MTRDISTIVLARLFRLAAGVAVAIVTSRVLGPAGRGEYFVVVTLAALVGQFGNLGLHASNTYLVARNRQLLSALLTNTIWLSALAAESTTVAILAAAYVLGAFGGSSNQGLWLLLLLAPMTLFLLLGENLLVGLRRTMAFNAMEVLNSGLMVTFHIVAAVWSPTAPGFLVARVSAMAVSVGVLLAMLVRGIALRGRFDLAIFRAGFGFSARAYLVALLGFLVLRLNVFLLQWIAGFNEVGIYSVASQVTDALEVIPSSISLVLFPRLLAERDHGWITMRSSLVRVAMIMAGVCVAIWVGSDALVSVAFGPEFSRASAVLRLLLPELFFISLTSIVSQFLAAEGMPRLLLVIWLAGLGGSAALGVMLIPPYKSEGAAVALSITYGVIFVLVSGLALRQSRRSGASAGDH